MPLDRRFQEQVRLLLSVLPLVDRQPCFALKGGTAINLFVSDLPRLSVDIDLAYLPLEPRHEALLHCREALAGIAQHIAKALPDARVQQPVNRDDELRLIVSNRACQIKIEVSPVLRGTLHPPERRDVRPSVEADYGFASMQVVSMPDLYGGKICAALDRQHPRDWFDVWQLLESGKFDRSLFVGFLVYLLGHPRPLSEVLAPRWKPLDLLYQHEFAGMLREPVALEVLEATRDSLLLALRDNLTTRDAEFLLGFMNGEPDWSLFAESIEPLPAVRWKLQNIQAMDDSKRVEEIKRLRGVLDNMLANPKK